MRSAHASWCSRPTERACNMCSSSAAAGARQCATLWGCVSLVCSWHHKLVRAWAQQRKAAVIRAEGESESARLISG